jgi:two-component system KDP operon response regulator KdpE
MNNRSRKRLLLADDQAQYRKSLRTYLELEGYDFAEAETPEDAIEILENETFNLVLADLRMRDENDSNDWGGIEVARFASQHGIPCIIVTAFPSVEVARYALRARGGEPFAQDLVTKASGPQAVLDSINSILNGRGLRSSEDNRGNDNGIWLDLTRKLVWKNNQLLKLSKNQYILLEELYKKDGGLCSCAELILAIYAEELPDKVAKYDKRLRNLVGRTKDKIEDPGSSHDYLEVVNGRGFRLNLRT